MPFHYTIDVARSLIVVELTGALTGEELLQMQSQLIAESAFDPAMRQICDIRNGDVSGVTSDAVKLIASRSTDGLVRGRRAIVASPGLCYGLSRMFAAYAGGDEDMTAVFSDIAEARRWLGVGDA